MQSEIDRLERARQYLAERTELGTKDAPMRQQETTSSFLGKIKEKFGGGSGSGVPDYTLRYVCVIIGILRSQGNAREQRADIRYSSDKASTYSSELPR
jgi:hypothetical protein